MQPSDPKLDGNLRARLAAAPGAAQPVVVSFRRWLTAEESAALGLGGEGRNLTGILAPDAIRSLAGNDEVIQIALVVEPKLSTP